ncbi:mannose/fructose/sorbose PTS transporter subunit IIA [Serratia ureilytica]
MAIAIIIGTHGAAAEQLLKTAEMLLGEQDNVAFIDFVPGENAETLIVKYNEKSVGWIPVAACCSWWIPGGSPFNAASRIAVDKENYEVVTGVNIPMLVETFMARDDNPAFDELVALALETGREGVKALKNRRKNPQNPQHPSPKPLPLRRRWGRMTT